MLIATGLRPGEIVGIKQSDLCLEKGFIHIHGKGNNLYTKRYRKVYIDQPDLLKSIRAYLRLRTHLDTEYLFCSWDGIPLRSMYISTMVRTLGLAAGLGKIINPTHLRQTFCSHLAAQGVDLSLFTIYRSREYLEKVLAFYEYAPVSAWNLRVLIDTMYAGGMGTVSVRHYTNHIKCFADFLIEMELLSANPFVDIRLKPKQKPEKKPLCKEERVRLLYVPLLTSKRVQPEFYQLRDTAILHLMLTTGIRLLEISELQISHVNLAEKVIRIYEKGNRNVPCKERLVYLENSDTLDIRTRYMVYRNSSSPYLFIKADGTKLLRGAYHYLMRDYGAKAGIARPINSCLLRASFASSMIENGIDPITLKELMGHNSIKITYRYYIFLREDHWSTTSSGGVNRESSTTPSL